MDQLAWFDQRDLQIHAQVVVCPGLNDGPALERTLNDLAAFAAGPWPAVLVCGGGASGTHSLQAG